MTEVSHRVHSWSRDEFEHMVAVGGFPPEMRVELLDGEIIDISPQKSAHATAVDLVEQALRVCFGAGFYIRGQKPLALDAYSEPEPDVAVIRGRIRDYVDHHPRTAELIVEVADSTLRYDRERKASVYARNGIAEYWILNLPDRTLEMHRDPAGGLYRQRVALHEGQTISPLAAPECCVVVTDLLP